MPERKIMFGNSELQKEFVDSHRAFVLEELPKLRAILEKVFVRELTTTPLIRALQTKQEHEALTGEETNQLMAGFVVFGLGRIAADDFTELLILAANGRGVGAFKILRGMYEHIITAIYISKYPSEADAFLGETFIQRMKISKRVGELFPGRPDDRTPEQIQEFELELQNALAKRKSATRPKCRQPISQEAWTRVNVDTMAEKAGPYFKEIYAPCYLIPTFVTHPTALGLESRFRGTETGFIYRDRTVREAHKAALHGHALMLRLLSHQNDYFQLGLEDEISSLYEGFPAVWSNNSPDERRPE